MLLRKFLCVPVYIFLQISIISCDEGSTLAFAIDDTLSMWDDITQVKSQSKSIMDLVLTEKNSEIKDFVLVTINDPDVVLRKNTSLKIDFQNALDNISIHNYNNVECEEMSMSGVEMALLASRSGSYIYVFTDASAKDYYKVERVKNLCQKKQTQVVFVLTGDCGHSSNRRYTVYHEIAAASGGQVFRVEKDEVSSVLETIKILLKGKNPAVKWTIVQSSITVTPVTFTIDEMADFAMVSTSGKNVYLRITTTNSLNGPEPITEKIMWIRNAKVVKLVNPTPGTYYAWVKGDSAVSVIVYARTDFTFEHGFSTLEPKSIKDTSKQPIAGDKQHLSINVTDPENSVTIKTAQILDINNDEHVIMNLPLRKTGKNFYITDAFVSPAHMFKIGVKGEITKTCKPITRMSKTAVEPKIIEVVVPETVPMVKISEGVNLNVNYGGEISLTCKVSAHPAPKIEWFTSRGVSMPSVSSLVEDTIYVSYLKLKNIKKDETYVCKARNKKGTKDSTTKIVVRPVFNTISVPPTFTSAKYKEDVKINCNIKSYLPMKVKWFLSGKIISSSDMHTISADGSQLTLKSMDVRMEGKYTCEASLDSDPTVKQTYQTEVKIDGLARPVIEASNKHMHLWKRNKLELNCRIVKGHPKPSVKWFKKNGDHYGPIQNVTSEVLTVAEATLAHAGQYKCVAENVKGSDYAEFEVIMSSLPEISIAEKERTYPYDSNIEFNCNVESLPPPTIIWMSEMGSILQNKVSQITEFAYANQLKLQNVKKDAVYICVTNNTLGSITEYVNITVLSPFIVTQKINGESGVKYGTEKILRCDIKSSKPMKLEWYLEESGTKSRRLPVDRISSKFVISSDGTELKIKSVDLEMVGKYTCEASLSVDPEEKVAFSTNVSIIDLMGPEVTYAKSFLDGKHYKAICRVKGVPKPTISWLFKPKGSNEFITISGSDEELDILELKLKDSGVYRCVAKNSLGATQYDFDVVVEEPPVIQKPQSTYRGIVGDLVMKIPCNVTGFPDPAIVWKEKGKVIENDSKFKIEGHILYIRKLKNPETKSFTCEAINKLGTATQTFDMEVVDTFENDKILRGDTHEIYVKEGTPVSIKCKIINSETRSVRWFINGEITNQTGNEYIIEKASMSDDKNYTCRVNTNEGSSSDNYILDVGFPPTFDDNSPSPKIIDWQIEYDNLDCMANSKPPSKYEWYHAGKKIDSLNDFTKKLITDWEEYTCVVSNVHGSIQKTFKVTTTGCYLTKNMEIQNMPLLTDASTPTWPFSLSNSDILLKEHQEIKLSCPNDRLSSNAFQMIPNKNEITAKCVTQDKFDVNGKTYKYSELQCTRQVAPSVVNKHEQCLGPNSEMIRVGFTVNGFLDAYKICYDTKLNVPLYARVPIPLTSLGYGAELSKFKWSSAPEVGNGKPSGGYTACKMLGKCCYTKEQLIQVNETAFGPAQAATFKENLNSVAVWNPCYGDRTSWQDFEKEIIYKPYNYDAWFSWTGASDYTIKNGGLVPRYIWKVMKYDEDSSVMVYVNEESPTLSDIRCTKPCESMMETSDKFLYCCSLEEFSKAFGIPLGTFELEQSNMFSL